MSRRGRPRKSVKPRHKCGKLVQDRTERIKPTPEHTARRCALGVGDREQCEVDSHIDQARFLSDEQKIAAHKYLAVRRAYYCSIGISIVSSAKLDGPSGKGASEPTERDQDIKDFWIAINKELGDAGHIVKSATLDFVEFNNVRSRTDQRKRIRQGLDCIAKFIGVDVKSEAA